VGAVGATVFVLTMVVTIWLLATRSSQVFPEDTSAQERRSWVGVFFLTILFISFASELIRQSEQGAIPQQLHDLIAHQVLRRFLLLLALWSMISHYAGRDGGKVEADERDFELRHRADRAGHWALTLIVLCALVVLLSVSHELLSWWLTPIVLANVLLTL